MKESLTERWYAWVEAAEEAGSARGDSISLYYLQENLAPALAKAGLAAPSRRSLEEALASNLEPAPTQGFGHKNKEGKAYSFAHLLNLIWLPVIEFMEQCQHQPAPQWTEQLGLHHSALVAEMEGYAPGGVDTPMGLDEWVGYMKATLLRLLEVDVSEACIRSVVLSVVPFHASPTPANALHILRSGLCRKLVGPALATQASRLILQEVAEVPVALLSPDDLAIGVRQDLVDSLHRQQCEPSEAVGPDEKPAKRSRTTEAIERTIATKTEQVLFMVKNRVASTRLRSTVEGACDLIGKVSHEHRTSFEQALGELLGDEAIRRHLLILDGAVDRLAAENLFKAREAGSFAGVAVATDESPPSQPRFRGLRFQVTVFYFGTYKALREWSSCDAPPILKSTCLADIMHCPGKKGVDVSRIIEKQLGRLGLNCFDVVSGTGDGGGENEGHQGVHAYFENLNPGYVRRRCLPHIAWRTCDQAIEASALRYRRLAAYLVEGITWQRLRELATRSVRDGGLNLFKDGSEACKAFFGKSPSAIVDGRPETDLQFLRFLEGKEHNLLRLATKDLEQRDLEKGSRDAILSLAGIEGRIQRRILQEVLERCQFLYYWSGKHPSVAAETSWDDLMKKAAGLIVDLGVSDKVLERFHLKEEDLTAMAARPKSWVDLAILQVVGEEDLVAGYRPEALGFHRRVTDQAAGHLHLLESNTYRTPWLAAKLLSEDKILAQDSATALVKHLATTRPHNRSSFEERLISHVELWKNLTAFATADPPTLLWHNNGRYQHLFQFLAPRFLLAPDHVLDAERVHARWQWACQSKRSQLLQALNGTLRLGHYLEHNQAFPSHEELLPHIRDERQQHRLSLQALDEDVAWEWRHLGGL